MKKLTPSACGMPVPCILWLTLLLYACNKSEGVTSGCTTSGNNLTEAVLFTDATINNSTLFYDRCSGIDYIITGTVEVEGKLTIQPGVTIAFKQDAGLVIKPGGVLQAEGTEGNPIVFTSQNRKRGTWRGITFLSNSPGNILSYCHLKDGGGEGGYGQANIIVGSENVQAAVQISHCEIATSIKDGLLLHSGSQLLNFVSNRFQTNTAYGITTHIAEAWQMDKSNQFSNNGKEFIHLIGYGCSPIAKEVLLAAQSLPYFLSGCIHFSNRLVIDPGVRLYMDSHAGIVIEGSSGNASLKAVGNAALPITIAPLFPGQGKWSAVNIVSSSSYDNLIEYCNISGGGEEGIHHYGNAILNVSVTEGTTAITVRNNSIGNSAGYAIYVKQAGCTYNADIATANQFVNNKEGNVLFQ
jgi:hypothetical protein